MIIGVIDGQQACSDPVLATIVDKRAVNPNDFSFCFQTCDKRPVENFRQWHQGLDMIGKHYLVCSANLPNVQRHYTICNTLVPSFYEEILRVADAAVSGKKADFDEGLLAAQPSNQLWLTLKNYRFPNGVSTHIYSAQHNVGQFYLKGPMGKGLEL